jgi:hypothetical protein
MGPQEYQSVLDRIERLERRDRRMRLERLVMLAAIAWLLATGPAWRLLVTAAPRLQVGEWGVRSVATRSLAELRGLLRVQPVLDSATVTADEREAFDQPALAPAPTRPAATPALASTVPPAAPQSGAAVEPKSPAPTTTSKASKPEISQSVRLTAPPSPNTAHARRPPAAHPSKSQLQAASLAAAGLSISRDVDKRLTNLPSDNSLQALALAEWPDSGAAVSRASEAALPAVGPAASPAAILPNALKPATASSASGAPAEAPAPPPAVPAAPVALKALGYAQAADGSAQIVLSNGNALFVVNEGQEFLDRFRVVSLRPEGVDVEDRLTNQTLHLTFGY